MKYKKMPLVWKSFQRLRMARKRHQDNGARGASSQHIWSFLVSEWQYSVRDPQGERGEVCLALQPLRPELRLITLTMERGVNEKKKEPMKDFAFIFPFNFFSDWGAEITLPGEVYSGIPCSKSEQNSQRPCYCNLQFFWACVHKQDICISAENFN